MREIEFRVKTEDGLHYVPSESFSLALHDTGNLLQVWSNDGIIDELPVLALDQFTGLRDKNGVKIFFGDIVKWGENIETVSFDDGYFQTETSMIDACMEVIGNVHQHPHLLEQKK